MSEGTVSLTKNDKLAIIEFSHPKGNSLPGMLLRSLASKFKEVATDDSISAVLLKSTGDKVFCAGASFDELLAVTDQQSSENFFGGFPEVLLAMKDCPQPVITAVQGKAIGGGVGLIAASDYVIAHPDAAARLSELALGFGPFIIGPFVERKIGIGNFQAMTLDTEWRDSRWCLATGLFSKILTESPFDFTSLETVLKICNSNAEALRKLKSIFWSESENLAAMLQERVKVTASLALTDFVRSKVKDFQK